MPDQSCPNLIQKI